MLAKFLTNCCSSVNDVFVASHGNNTSFKGISSEVDWRFVEFPAIVIVDLNFTVLAGDEKVELIVLAL